MHTSYDPSVHCRSQMPRFSRAGQHHFTGRGWQARPENNACRPNVSAHSANIILGNFGAIFPTMLGLPCTGKLVSCVQVVNVEATGRDNRCWSHGTGVKSSFRLGLQSFLSGGRNSSRIQYPGVFAQESREVMTKCVYIIAQRQQIKWRKLSSGNYSLPVCTTSMELILNGRGRLPTSIARQPWISPYNVPIPVCDRGESGSKTLMTWAHSRVERKNIQHHPQRPPWTTEMLLQIIHTVPCNAM
jgi:hypothetical protein